MLFNSFPFLLLFLPVVVAGYFAVPNHRLRLLLIVGASYYFYAYADWWFPALMAGSTAISFTGGLLLGSERLARHRRLVLGLGIFGVLALLGYFKYAGFAGGYGLDFVHVLTGRGFPGAHTFVRSIVLPIGISFYTFEGISYMVDVYRGGLPVERDLLRYAFFISFFPHLIAGPIVRYGIMQPQLMTKHRFDPDRIRSGLLLFTLGLAKKVLLADGLARWVDHYLATPARRGSSPPGRARSASASRSTSTSAPTPTWRSGSPASSGSSCRGTSTGPTAPRARRSSGAAGT